MQTYLNSISAIALTLGLAACGGGGGGSTSTGGPVTPSEPPVTREAFSTTGKVIVRNFADGTATLGAAQDVDVVFEYVDGSEELTATLTVFGRTVVFTEEDLNAEGFEFAKDIDGGQEEAYLWLVFDTVADIQDKTTYFDYFVMFGTSDFDASSQINNRAYGVFGYETPAADLPSGSATYTGPVFGQTLMTSGDDAKTYRLDGDFIVDVDFGSGDVTNGRIYNLAIDDNPIVDTYDLVDTMLSGSSFNTTVIADTNGCVTDCAFVSSSSVDGAFYGPAAAETGGNFAIAGINSAGGEYVAHGVFGGNPTPP